MYEYAKSIAFDRVVQAVVGSVAGPAKVFVIKFINEKLIR
jgi:hypothetical protein